MAITLALGLLALIAAVPVLTACVPEDSSRIAFVSEREGVATIYTMRPDGSAVSRVGNVPGPAVSPSWSPDGRIAFKSSRDGDAEVNIVSVDGSRLRRLTQQQDEDSQPAWSPDGSRIAFHSHRDGRQYGDSDRHGAEVCDASQRRIGAYRSGQMPTEVFWPKPLHEMWERVFPCMDCHHDPELQGKLRWDQYVPLNPSGSCRRAVATRRT